MRLPDGASFPRGFARDTRFAWPLERIDSHVKLAYGRGLTASARRPGPIAVFGSNGQCGVHDEPLAKGPGVILGRKGQGPLGVVWCDGDFWVIDTAYYAQLESDSLDLRYFYYSAKYIGLNHLKDGTSNPTLSRDRFGRQAFPLPPLPTQRRIAGILSAYDDLIENNTKRIKILEEMARALYREWFVHFRFPGHEKVKLVDSPLGQIPEGWEVSRLVELQADVPNAINGGPFGSKLGRKDYVDEGVPVIRGANLTTTGRFKDFGYVYVTPEKAETLRSNFARPGDVVVTQRGTLGQVARIPANTDFTEFVISQSQMKVTFHDEKVDNDYGFYCLKSHEAVERLKNLASSSGVPHINLSTLREFTIRVPPFELQRAFGEVVSQEEALIENLTRQNTVLANARDLLLPRLISGEIDVDALDLPEAEQ